MMEKFILCAKEFFRALYCKIDERFNDMNRERADEIATYEENRGIRVLIRAMMDVKAKDEAIIKALQDYYDLRRSEAENFLYNEKTRRSARLGSINNRKKTNKDV